MSPKLKIIHPICICVFIFRLICLIIVYSLKNCYQTQYMLQGSSKGGRLCILSMSCDSNAPDISREGASGLNT